MSNRNESRKKPSRRNRSRRSDPNKKKINKNMISKKEPRKNENKHKLHESIYDPKFDPYKIIPLENSWTLWYHDKDNIEWDPSTFTKLNSFNTIQDFWRLYNNIRFIDQCFFLMKGNIFPRWEAPENSIGGTWSINISRNQAADIWLGMSMLLTGETLSKYMGHINGISIRPKFRVSVFKIWTNNVPVRNNKFLENFKQWYNMSEINDVLGKSNNYLRGVKFIKSS